MCCAPSWMLGAGLRRAEALQSCTGLPSVVAEFGFFNLCFSQRASLLSFPRLVSQHGCQGDALGCEDRIDAEDSLLGRVDTYPQTLVREGLGPL